MTSLPRSGMAPAMVPDSAEQPAAARAGGAARPGLSGVEPEDLARWFEERGQPVYRARQVNDAVWRALATSAAEFRTLPAAIRKDVEATFRADTLVATEVRVSDGGLTEKA